MSSPPLTIQQQADFVWMLMSRCRMRDGSDACTTHLTLTSCDVEVLRGLHRRLDAMAPHEAGIRKLVVGK